VLLSAALWAAACAAEPGDAQPEPEPWDGLPGAELALEPPPPDEGFQIHYGPDDADDPDAAGPFVLRPGEERTNCTYSRAPNDADVLFSRYVATARPGTHHFLVSAAEDLGDAGAPGPCAHGDARQLYLLIQGGLRPEGARVEYPPADRPMAPENEGIGAALPAGQLLEAQMHAINTTDAPLLREGWVNVWYAAEGEITQRMERLTFYAGLAMSIPPKSRETIEGGCPVPAEAPEGVRILDVFGHFHAHGERISVWKVDPLGDRALIYESYEWAELERLSFNSVQQNAPPNPEARTFGGHTGVLRLLPGEQVAFACDFNNTEDFSLQFGSQAFTAEMCAVIGNFVPGAGHRWHCADD
jgi:hypothetical protein